MNRRVVFWGTPEFAVPALFKLENSGYEVVCVITQPDRRKGRGKRLVSPPVKEAALKLDIPVIQEHDSLLSKRLSAYEADWFVVAAYGRLLSKSILDIPKSGCINIHASLLPKYRGAAPVQWAIINRERQTGVTTMLMDEGLDTGDILMKRSTPILEKESAGSLMMRLADMGAELLIETMDGIKNGAIEPVPQDHSLASWAPILKKSDGHLNWSLPAEQIEALIRGLFPWPGAYTFLGGKRLKLMEADVINTDSDLAPGSVILADRGRLLVSTGSGMLSILRLQGESGKPLATEDFLRGNPIPAGSVLE